MTDHVLGRRCHAVTLVPESDAHTTAGRATLASTLGTDYCFQKNWY